MRVTRAVHPAARPRRWVIDEIAPDFNLLDVWELPAYGRREEFGDFLEVMATWDPAAMQSITSRLLFEVRRGLGALLRWDDPEKTWPIPGSTETTLRVRVPEELRHTAADAPRGSDELRHLGADLVPLYRTETEAAAEIVNATVHGVIHFRWVEQRRNRFQAHMAVYVVPRGALGKAYLLLIQPFRHLIVYPALLRQVQDTWSQRSEPDDC